MAYWQELTEKQKREEYGRYTEEVKTKHTEGQPMTYEEFCREWDDCKTIEV